MGIDNWLLLNRLRRTVKKIRFLLKLNINKWKLAASMLGASTSRNRRRLSFNDRPGLRAVCSEDDEDDESSNHHPGSSRELQRTTSYKSSSSWSSSDDVDKRAEMFIANFYRQLQMERQVSLQLRYNRGNSFDSSVSP